MSLVHICLYLENEGREALGLGGDHLLARAVRKRTYGHSEEVFKEGLYTEVIKSRAEENGRKLTAPDLFKVKIKGSAIQELDLVNEGLPHIRSYKGIQLFGVGNITLDGLNAV